MSTGVKKFLLAVVIFGISVAGPSYTLIKKGYTPGADYMNLVEARNYALGGTYRSENSINTLLSSEQSVQNGVVTGIPNPLTPILYGHIFSWFGFNPNLPFWLSIFLFGLFSVIIFYLTANLFGIMSGFFAGITSALMPSMTVGVLYGGLYEWAMLFFGIALWSYFGSKKGQFSAGYSRVFISGIFFALAALARNAFSISFIPIFLFDAWHTRSFKRSAALLVPFLIIFGSTLTPFSWLDAPNGYTSNVNKPWTQIGHFYNDPYTYNFNRESYKNNLLSDPEKLDRVGISYAIYFGYPVTFGQRLKVFKDSALFYVSDTVSLTSTGGVVVLFLAAIGAVWLWKNQRVMAKFFGVWFATWLLLLIYSRTANWDHSMEIVFIIASLVGLGCSRLVGLIRQEGFSKNISILTVAILLIGHLSAGNQWRLFDEYRSSRISSGVEIVESVNQGNFDKKSVIAIGTRSEVAYMVNYKTDRSTVYFHPDTLASFSEPQLREAFAKYGVTHAAGFEDEDLERMKRVGITILQ